MAVSAEDVHVVVLVDVSAVAVTSSGPARHHAELGLTHGWVACHSESSSLSTLAHLLIVGVEGVVSVLDDERLLHRDGSG